MEPEVLRGRLLGPPRFLLGERELSFPFRKVEALLAYVLLEGKASRESLASLFWGGRDEVLAARNLRNALYQLRLLLPEGVVLADRVWVARGDYPTDLDLEGLDRLGEDEDLAARCVRPVLEGFSLPDSPEFDEWLRTVRSRWESRGRRALLDLARRRAALSPPGALGPLRRLLEADGGDEEAARILMDCLGRRIDLLLRIDVGFLEMLPLDGATMRPPRDASYRHRPIKVFRTVGRSYRIPCAAKSMGK